MMLVRAQLKESPIEGIGVFAAEPIAKGAVVWQFEPEFDKEIARDFYETATGRLRDYLDRYSYFKPGDDSVLVLEGDEGRYLNHSTDPNTDFSGWPVAVALRDIAPGEEITCDYSTFCPGYELY